MKRIIAALLAGLCLFALVGCSAGSKADSAAPKDYSQISTTPAPTRTTNTI